MKITYKLAAVMAGASLFLSSCVVDGVYGGFGVSGPGYNASVAWSNASYDAEGFPIFGYSYGQPVYGYTPAGAAVLSFAALTALCFVPHWGPAPWYHGHWHYPPHIHRVAAPPHYPHGHMPHMRPHGGLNAPIHRNPGAVLRPNHHSAGPAWTARGRDHSPRQNASFHGNASRPGGGMPGGSALGGGSASRPGGGMPGGSALGGGSASRSGGSALGGRSGGGSFSRSGGSALGGRSGGMGHGGHRR